MHRKKHSDQQKTHGFVVNLQFTHQHTYKNSLKNCEETLLYHPGSFLVSMLLNLKGQVYFLGACCYSLLKGSSCVHLHRTQSWDTYNSI